MVLGIPGGVAVGTPGVGMPGAVVDGGPAIDVVGTGAGWLVGLGTDDGGSGGGELAGPTWPRGIAAMITTTATSTSTTAAELPTHCSR